VVHPTTEVEASAEMNPVNKLSEGASPARCGIHPFCRSIEDNLCSTRPSLLLIYVGDGDLFHVLLSAL
jgi:hypothetical protein